MKMLKIAGGVLLAGFIMTFGSEVGDRLSIPGAERLVATADAIVGRPLTPVSVAGVARRSVRRCAVGVYRCSLPADGSLRARLDGDAPSDRFRPETTTPTWEMPI